jgi:hypothetical protein
MRRSTWRSYKPCNASQPTDEKRESSTMLASLTVGDWLSPPQGADFPCVQVVDVDLLQRLVQVCIRSPAVIDRGNLHGGSKGNSFALGLSQVPGATVCRRGMYSAFLQLELPSYMSSQVPTTIGGCLSSHSSIRILLCTRFGR